VYVLKAPFRVRKMSATHLTEQDSLSEQRKAAALGELARVLESPAFRGSRRCCRFLEYSVHQVLKGSAQEGLKERTIGIEALQRPPDYDTGEDAIVRVTANEVRKRLAQYYQGAGSTANPVISLPAGSYAAAFHWHDQPAPVAPAPVLLTEPRRSTPRRTVAIAVGLLIAMAGIIGVRSWIASGPARNAALQRGPVKPDVFWAGLFDPGHKTNIVVSDTVYREVQYFLGRDISLREYLAPGYPNTLLAGAKPEARTAIEFLGRQQTTSIGSATLGSRLLQFGSRMSGDPVIRYPRHINAREFNTDNFILLGSRLSIPWEQLFEPSLNFPLANDSATHNFYLQNRNPKPGEQAEYRVSGDETYADIAVLPNLAGTGTVLILNGIDMAAAEAAGEFAINGSLSARVGPKRRAEVLIRVRAIGGTVANMQLVAER
jgi:hypothetical protein